MFNALDGMQNYAKLINNLDNYKKYLREKSDSDKNENEIKKELALLMIEAKKSGIKKIPDYGNRYGDEKMVEYFENKIKEEEKNKQKNLDFINEIGEIPSGWKAGNLENYTRGLSIEQEKSFSTEDYFQQLQKSNNEFARLIINGKTSTGGNFDLNGVQEAQGLGIAALEDGNIEFAAKAFGSVSKMSEMSGIILEKYNQVIGNLSEEQKNKFLSTLEVESNKQRDVKKDFDANLKNNWGQKLN